jgi:hypothetical protein
MTDQIDPKKIFYVVIEPDEDGSISQSSASVLPYNFVSEGAANDYVKAEMNERGDGEFIIGKFVPLRRFHRPPPPDMIIEEFEAPTGQRRRSKPMPFPDDEPSAPETASPPGVSGGGDSVPAPAATDSEAPDAKEHGQPTGLVNDTPVTDTAPPQAEEQSLSGASVTSEFDLARDIPAHLIKKKEAALW